MGKAKFLGILILFVVSACGTTKVPPGQAKKATNPPPGQMKKATGSKSAAPYAPGQQKKSKPGKGKN